MINTFKKTYQLPFKYEIPYYKDTTAPLKRISKFIRRYLYLAINGQISLEQNKIKENQRNILWINMSAPSLGDSLMDLSSRILLENKNIDLFTDSKNAHIYKSDKVFKNIYVSQDELSQKKYDLIIIDSYSTRSLKIKFKYFRNIPFVGMYGYYNGPEVNRVLYSFHRMNQLLNYNQSENEVNSAAKATMFISSDDEKFIKNENLLNDYITIAIGGEWDYRTYNSWDKIIGYILTNYPNEKIVLIGSNNAKDEEKALLGKFNNKNLISVVAKYSFMQTAQIIKNSKVLICCDGGLMNVANCFNKPVVALFAHVEPHLRFTNQSKDYALYNNYSVKNISENEVINKFNQYKKGQNDN